MTSTPDKPEQPTTGTCLVCATQQDLEPSGRIAQHWTTAEEHGIGESFSAPAEPVPGSRPSPLAWYCMGSRQPRELGDGHDFVRIRAVIQSAKLRAEAKAQRRDMLAQTGGWQMADLVMYWTHRIVPLEENARRWGQLAVHGQWPLALKDALADIARRHDSTSKLDNAVGELKRSAAREWLRAIRWDVGEHFADGLTQDDLTTILFSI